MKIKRTDKNMCESRRDTSHYYYYYYWYLCMFVIEKTHIEAEIICGNIEIFAVLCAVVKVICADHGWELFKINEKKKKTVHNVIKSTDHLYFLANLNIIFSRYPATINSSKILNTKKVIQVYDKINAIRNCTGCVQRQIE